MSPVPPWMRVVWRRPSGAWRGSPIPRPPPPPRPQLSLFSPTSLPDPLTMPPDTPIYCLAGCPPVQFTTRMLVDWRRPQLTWGEPLCECGCLRGKPAREHEIR